jgi:molecular chaperone DnaK
MAQKQIEELKTLLKDEKWDELKQRLDTFEQAASQFAKQQDQGPKEPKK